MPDYLIYPFKTMNITQSYGMGNHAAHNIGNPKDYPIDEAGANTGRDWFYCPCDGMKIVRLYGNQTVGYHAWLESEKKVSLADGSTDYVTILAVHMNYDDYKKLKVGQKYKRKAKIFREGTTGKATGNHCHFAAGKGKSSANGVYWKQNSKGSWVLVTSGGPLKPEQAYYIDKSFTKVVNAYGIKFKTMPTPPAKKLYKTTLDALNMRSGVGTASKTLLTIPNDKKVEVLKAGAGDANGYKWDKVKYGGKEGFVAAKYLSSYKTTLDALNMRSGAGTASKTLLTIPKGKNVEVLKADAGDANGYKWSKVSYGGKEGFVAAKYLK